MSIILSIQLIQTHNKFYNKEELLLSSVSS